MKDSINPHHLSTRALRFLIEDCMAGRRAAIEAERPKEALALLITSRTLRRVLDQRTSAADRQYVTTAKRVALPATLQELYRDEDTENELAET